MQGPTRRIAGDGEPGCERYRQGAGERDGARRCRHGLEAVHVHAEDGRDVRHPCRQPSVRRRRPAGHGVASTWSRCFRRRTRTGANGNRDRPDGEAGGDASEVSALAGRKLSRGQPHSPSASTGRRRSAAGRPARRIRARGAIARRTAWACWSFWSGART